MRVEIEYKVKAEEVFGILILKDKGLKSCLNTFSLNQLNQGNAFSNIQDTYHE